MLTNDINPSLLRALVAIHDTGGFSAAARELNVTQSAISHQINRLEERVGRPLLKRTTRQVTFTEDGRELLRHATRLLDAIHGLNRHLSPSVIKGVVRFGIPEAVLGNQLPPLLAQFRRLFPRIRLEVTVDMSLDLRRAVDAGKLDLAVIMDAEPIEQGQLLRTEQLQWVASDSFQRRSGEPLPLALHPPPCVNRTAILNALQSGKVDWTVAFTCASTHGIQSAIQAGFAVTALCASQITLGMRQVGDEFTLSVLPVFHLGLIKKACNNPPVEEFERLIARALRSESTSVMAYHFSGP